MANALWQIMVEQFHRETGGTIGITPAVRDNELRARLIMEEAVETVAALGFSVQAEIFKSEHEWSVAEQIAHFAKTYNEANLVDVIDGLCDLIYVALGTAVAAGVDLTPHFAEVQRANMTKLNGPKREDGKQLKPKDWLPPNHEQFLPPESV